jgi:hypothetical protein
VLALADLRALLACLRSRPACFAGLVPASSRRVVARPNFAVTLDGTTCPAHAGLATLASRLHRAVVQGSVVVAVVLGAEVVLVVVVLGVEVVLVVVIVGCVVVDPSTRIGSLRAIAVSWL